MRRTGRYGRVLRGAPVVDIAHLMHAADGATGRAALLGEELALYVSRLISRERNARISTLLAAIVRQTELADLEVASACTAAPVVRLPVGDRLLEVIESRVTATGKLSHLVPDGAFGLAKRL